MHFYLLTPVFFRTHSPKVDPSYYSLLLRFWPSFTSHCLSSPPTTSPFFSLAQFASYYPPLLGFASHHSLSPPPTLPHLFCLPPLIFTSHYLLICLPHLVLPPTTCYLPPLIFLTWFCLPLLIVSSPYPLPLVLSSPPTTCYLPTCLPSLIFAPHYPPPAHFCLPLPDTSPHSSPLLSFSSHHSLSPPTTLSLLIFVSHHLLPPHLSPPPTTCYLPPTCQPHSFLPPTTCHLPSLIYVYLMNHIILYLLNHIQELKQTLLNFKVHLRLLVGFIHKQQWVVLSFWRRHCSW